MFSWILPFLLTFALTGAPTDSSAPAIDSERAAAIEAHDFHVSYSRMAVEGTMAVVRIRMFKDDLAQALTEREGHDITVDISPELDSLFTTYFNDSFLLRSDEETLQGSIVGSGEETVGNEAMWWYLLEFNASSTIETLYVEQRILAEIFDDQKNIVQIQHFPSEQTYSLYCAEDAWEYVISFTDD
ncbi:MAG: hypothetical protein OXT73_06020 [Bacteroidota bacterium]|nr:hypothetical protein [Bacteroidota bacterium]